MEWTEDSIVLTSRAHGETSAIVELLTREHGRHMGLVRGGRSRRLRAVIQPGNQVIATWRARLSEHLGTFALEPVNLRAAGFFDDGFRLSGLTALCALAQALPEREPHARVFDAFSLVLDELETGAHWPAMMVRFELGLLEELGFGLDLAACASTGAETGLVYVSPKSGRAVSREAGAPYSERMLPLPAFLGSGGSAATLEDVLGGFSMTGHFLEKHIWGPRELKAPPARQRLLTLIAGRIGS